MGVMDQQQAVLGPGKFYFEKLHPRQRVRPMLNLPT